MSVGVLERIATAVAFICYLALVAILLPLVYLYVVGKFFWDLGAGNNNRHNNTLRRGAWRQ